MDEAFYMTQKGYNEAVERLKYLQVVKRMEITQRIKTAENSAI
jgi:transcription elongation GreA/GreB family factor